MDIMDIVTQNTCDLHHMGPEACDGHHMRHAVSGLDFWGYPCYTCSIRQLKYNYQKRKVHQMNTVKLNEVLAQTPEQTLADYARLDALIAKGTYSDK